jgi:hypothetical protein
MTSGLSSNTPDVATARELKAERAPFLFRRVSGLAPRCFFPLTIEASGCIVVRAPKLLVGFVTKRRMFAAIDINLLVNIIMNVLLLSVTFRLLGHEAQSEQEWERKE